MRITEYQIGITRAEVASQLGAVPVLCSAATRFKEEAARRLVAVTR